MENTKTKFVVIAEFKVSADRRDEFLDLCKFDAERSVNDEAGCQQFDVNTSDGALESIVLYEVYDDRAAFDRHLTTPHYATFAEGLEHLGVQKINVRFFSRQYP